MSGVNIVGIQFRQAGKMYDFSCGDMELQVGDYVVVDTDRGPSLAQVIKIRFELEKDLGERELKPILRKATAKELEKKTRLSEQEVNEFTNDRVRALNLEMRVLHCEIQFGGNKVIVYFTAPGRVDFRELVKDLAGGLKTRVELKQVGARDETKILGGLGICGRQYCCSSFLREFVPVSIRMAKNQNLALNPAKVSGGCGRLLCCLTYEDEIYSELRQTLPPRGTRVRILERGDQGHVVRCDVLNQLVLVETENQQQLLIPIKELEILEKISTTAADEVDDHWGDDIDLSLLIEDSAGVEGEQGAKRPHHHAKKFKKPHQHYQQKNHPKDDTDAKAGDSDEAPSTQKQEHRHKKPHFHKKSNDGLQQQRPHKGKNFKSHQGQGQKSHKPPQGGGQSTND